MTLMGPTASAQLMLSASSVTGLPAVADIVSATGRRRACTALFEQLSDLAAFNRFPVMVLSRAATVSPPLSR